ncbi:MAG: DUF5916 domain-containing protein [Bacteroidota bacterium]
MRLIFLHISLFTVCLPIILTGQQRDTGSRQSTYNYHIKKTSEKIILDGNLDESAWENADDVGDFWMSFPRDDRPMPPETQTKVRVTYNDQFLYVGAICSISKEIFIPTLKRDSRDLWTGEIFAVLLDPVNESTNGFNFGCNPAGVQMEALISGRTGTRSELNTRGSSGINSAWDNKWFVETSRGDNYWIAEIAIPFKSLRFDPGKKVWGINFTRGEPHSNSWSTWVPVPVQFLTVDLGYTGGLVFEVPPKKAKSNVSVIPYILGSAVKDYEEGTKVDPGFRVGGDAKVAITSSLNLDVTINPDFSQVDVDEQVTNLTTFNIRFPERRLFFLENSDIFSNFGIPPMRPFFSRRIGLDENGQTIPILYGVRLSGNLNKDLRIGLMNMHTREDAGFPGQNYTSLALHQQVLERSVIRGYVHNRQAMVGGNFKQDDFNRTAGMEFQYFSQDAKWQGFGGGGISQSNGLKGDNFFYNVGGGYDGRKFTIYANIAGIGDNYYADMGWIPSADHYDAVRDTSIHIGYQHWFSRASYTIFPKNQNKINNHRFSAVSIADLNNQFELLQNQARVGYTINFANTARMMAEYRHQDNWLQFPFTFTGDEPLPVAKYQSDFVRVEYRGDSRKDALAGGSLQYGSFYGGTRLEAGLGGRYRVQPWGTFGVRFIYNKLEFPDPYGSRDLFLISPRIEINFSRNIFWTTFLQYNTQADNFNINSRLQWRFQPMSDLFIVYTDNYAVEFWGQKNRGIVVKLNYWLNL